MNSLTKLNNPLLFKTIFQRNNSFRGLSFTQKLNSNIFNVQDEADFKKRVLENGKPVIVDFHAVWCGPCKILGPRLEKLMTEYVGKADFAKVDIDQCYELAEKYSVNSVPTVIAMKNGKEVSKFTGLIDEDRIKQFVKTAVGS